MLAPWKKSYEQPRQHIKKQRHYFANKDPSSQSYGFSRSHAWMWELDYKESWTPKNWCFWTIVLEKTLDSPLDSKEIKPVHPKGNQSWIFTGRTDAEAETPILWPPDVKNWFIKKKKKKLNYWERPWFWKRLKAGGEGDDRGWDGWMASLTQWTMEFEKVLGTGDGHRSLACCSPWGCKESDMNEQLNWIELHLESVLCDKRPPQWRQGRVAPAPHNFRKPTQSNKDLAQPKIINV